MRFPPSLLDEIRQRLPVSQVVGRRVKLKRQGREYAGLSPFKAEKTPSFTVNDQKGFYHCFSSGEHGDVFRFVMTTEGLSFTEAVERLAKEAGVPLPSPEPKQQEREAEFDRLRRLTEASAAFFERELRGGAGREARDYLARRGVSEEEVASFRLGYAPESRDKLKAHLKGLGFNDEEAARAGMLISGEDIATPYDRFRNRLMFPITNLSGTVIAFGGRALKAEQQPKYLNSPETPLFHKGSVLFNAHMARKSAYDRKQVIVAEGYMDVIALARAGFPNAVAPLGTALTEDQLNLLWRMADEPILCFDGDMAGRKAAFRALDVALPHVKPGATLRFAFLPDGLDPDDLLRASGPGAVAKVLEDARPLIDVLWMMQTEGASFTTPEAQAGLKNRLKARAALIADRDVSHYYLKQLEQRLWKLFNAARYSGGERGQNAGAPQNRRGFAGKNEGRAGARAARSSTPPPASTSLLQSALVQGSGVKVIPREAAMLMMLVNHPSLIDEEAEVAAQIVFSSSALNRLRDAIFDIHTETNPLDKEALRNQLTQRGLGAVMAQVEHAITHPCDWHTQPDAPKQSVVIGWRQMMALHRKSSLKPELEAAKQAFDQDLSEQSLLKLLDLNRQLVGGQGEDAAIEGYAAATEEALPAIGKQRDILR